MFGWRARLGVIIPSANTTVEGEFNEARPAGVSVHVSRARSTSITPEGMREMAGHAERAASELVDASVDAIAYACTSGTFTLGPSYGAELEKRLEEHTGVPVVTTATALLAALRSLGLSRIVMVSPYTDEVNRLEVAFLRHHGVEVLAQAGLGHSTPGTAMPLRRRRASHIGLEPAYASYALAKRVWEDSCEADAPEGIFISCTNFPSFEIIESLEADLGIPVVTSNQATLWAALALARVADPSLTRLGRLFSATGAGIVPRLKELREG